VTVVFDPKFHTNKTVYAGTDAASTTASRQRIFRFVVGKSDEWESIDANLPVGSLVGQVAAAQDGALYAVSSKAVVTSTEIGGVERSLNPSSSLAPTFETSVRGLNDGVTLVGLWLSGNQLWSIDTTNTRLMTFVDTLTRAPALTSPEDEAGGLEINGVRLDWEALDGATNYEWQLDDDDAFSSIPSGFEGSSEGSSCRLPALDMATTHFWRVRATEPVSSPWSVKWSFTTKLGAGLVAPQLLSPEPGAEGIARTPVFQWSAIAGAGRYELLVSRDNEFSDPAIVRDGDSAMLSTAWRSNISLDQGATYFWKVRATGKNTTSGWSAVGAFTVQTPQITTTPPVTPMASTGTVASVPQITVTQIPGPGPPAWVFVVIAVIGLLLVVLLAAILVALVRRR